MVFVNPLHCMGWGIMLQRGVLIPPGPTWWELLISGAATYTPSLAYIYTTNRNASN